MGICRDGKHKRSASGAKRVRNHKKRNNMKGRPPASTKLGDERVKKIKVRGGNSKDRALRINMGEYKMYNSNNKPFTCKAKIEDVVHHPSSNELARTNTITKSSIVKLDPTPFTEQLKNSDLSVADPVLKSLIEKKTLYGIVTTRPGQEGKADGHVLQGDELKFYLDSLNKKKKSRGIASAA